MQSRTASVLGASGFIGLALADALDANGWDCWRVPRDTIWPQTDRPLGHVFYCVGMTADYLRQPAATLEAHAGLLARVLQSDAYESLTYLSSTRVYDDVQSRTMAADEQTPLPICAQLPRHFYDLTKLTGESLCHALGHGRARVARLSCVYADAAEQQGFLPGLLTQVASAPRGATVTVASSPHFARDYVYRADVIRGMIALAEAGSQQVYNLASGVNLRNDELAALIETHTGRQIRFASDHPAAAPVAVDMQRFEHEFGWRPAPVADHLVPLLQRLSGDCT